MNQQTNYPTPYRIIFLAAALLLLLLATTTTAHAHTRVEVGPYALIVGWVSEPPIVGERNALYIEIFENEQPLSGAEATLDGELQYGDRTFRVNLNPTAEPGIYHAEIFPTVRGQYALRLFGTLGEMDIDETIEPEEVFAASRLHFPEPQPDPRELQREIAQLQSDLQSARALAIGGLLVGVLGLITGGISLVRRR
jgi:hypothetical protein